MKRLLAAGAGVVNETVAQPIESQVIGVDNMIYMKSTSGNDGSYTLTVSFKVGTDPDAFTVHDGKLYLNYSLPVQATWLQDTDAYIGKGRANWEKLEHEPYEP